MILSLQAAELQKKWNNNPIPFYDLIHQAFEDIICEELVNGIVRKNETPGCGVL